MATLVLLPGLDGTGQLFSDFAAALGSDVEIIVVSYPTEISLDYPALEAIARSLLPQDKPFFLLAESFSGPIGIRIAASPPSGLLGLILCASFARNPLPALTPLQIVLPVIPVAALPIASFSFFLLGRFSTPAHRASLTRSLALVAPTVLKARAREALSVDVSDLLSRITIPVLYLRAREDRVVRRTSSELIVSQLPKAKVVEFPAPHFLLQTLPTPAASTVLEFVKQTENIDRDRAIAELLVLLERIVRESGDPRGFDAAAWLNQWC
jgi:pimeloyl-ACP methyl ester carboxylesterase